MSSLSESIQRSRYMDIKGHNELRLETRDIKADRALCVRLSKTKSVTKSVTKAPDVVTSLYTILKGM